MEDCTPDERLRNRRAARDFPSRIQLRILRAREPHARSEDLVPLSSELNSDSETRNGKLMFGQEGSNCLVVDFEVEVATMRGGYAGDGTADGYLNVGITSNGEGRGKLMVRRCGK